MTLDEIYKNTKISMRSYNVCRDNGIDDINSLKEYYLINGSFEKLRNCGKKTNEELIALSNRHQLIIEQNITKELNRHSINNKSQNLTRIQREVINSFIHINSNSLSVRSKNALSKFLNGNFSIRNFTEKILLNKEFAITNIENIGKRSIPEIEIYISIINDFLIDVKDTNNEKQLIALKNNFLIQRTFSISIIPTEILQSESIFQLTEFLLNNNAIFNKNHNLTIQKALKIYQNDKQYTLEEIALESNISRERVRQIRKESVNELFEKLSFITNFNDDLFKNYGIDLSSILIEIKENLVNKINTFNKTNFSKEFISYILAVYLSSNFVIIGNIEDVLLPKFLNRRNRHNWNNFYIVNKELSKVDFISFANDVNERLNERIEETYSFNFKSYLSKFINDVDFATIEIAFPIAEKIMNDEFALYLDLNDNIVFKRNTIKQAFEYSYEALEELGKPSKVEDITLKINELHPNYETDKNKVRSSLKRINGFVPIGRTSVFGLKKWENEIEDFKGGTIRSIIIEFLEKFITPKHISLISEYISTFREETYQRSIIDNLKADKSNSFIFLRQGFIGLNSRKEKYDIDKYQKLPVHFGKTLISLNKKGYSKQDIKHYIISNFNLNEEEALAIINNLEL